MSLNVKKFLDGSGTGHLWDRIEEALGSKVSNISVAPNDHTIEIGGTATAPTIKVKISTAAGNSLTSDSTGLYVHAQGGTVYSISKKATANDGYAATYQLTADGVPTGTDIDIPKDMVVSAGEVKTVITADSPYEGAVVGDKYIELTLANSNGDKLYIPASSLVEYVTSGSSAGDMVVISVDSNHRVTASISDGTIPETKLTSELQSKINGAIQSVTEGSSNGTISVDGVDVAVHGLGTAAYASSNDFDVNGAAMEVYNSIVALTNAEIDAIIASRNVTPANSENGDPIDSENGEPIQYDNV